MVLGAVLGKWWVPERPDRRVSGSLAAGDSFAQLSLIGDLEPPSTGNGFALFGLYEYDVVHGYEAAPFRKFTLFECSGTITPNFEPSYFDTRQELTVNAAVLVGCHMDKFDARTVSAARAQIFGLDHWLGAGTYIDELHRTVDEKSGAIKWTAETRSADFGTITLAQGMRIRAIDTGSRESSHAQDGTIFTVADNVAIEISYDTPVTIHDSIEDARIFLGLVTLFTGSTAWIQSRSILLQGRGDTAFELLESGHRALAESYGRSNALIEGVFYGQVVSAGYSDAVCGFGLLRGLADRGLWACWRVEAYGP
ncbi:ApeA N-terminal domain 1-containing protein [Rathayibacter soli]|uniref:ApeA N-terminal domain 1-containing protein n=1 Tax=Rathayibacter soli TaxID=3144168 RepID=UPI0027E53F35|nr:hypothetical protein [Glaciibacter superstes]